MMASEAAVVSQTIDGTTITIEYSRPSLRGRDARTEMFGDQIPWGAAWTPGANEATTIEADKGFTLSDTPVPAGRWSVWMVVGPDDWELVLDPRDDLYHTDHPKPADDQIRIPIRTRRALDVMETLTWSFPAVRAGGADLRMQWGDIAVDLTVDVESTVRLTLETDEARPYVGSWTVERLASAFGDEGAFETEVRHTDGVLVGTLAFGDDFVEEVAFVPAADQVFRLGFMINGELAEVMAWTFVEFVMDDDGRAGSFEFRDPDDALLMRGRRVQPPS